MLFQEDRKKYKHNLRNLHVIDVRSSSHLYGPFDIAAAHGAFRCICCIEPILQAFKVKGVTTRQVGHYCGCITSVIIRRVDKRVETNGAFAIPFIVSIGKNLGGYYYGFLARTSSSFLILNFFFVKLIR